MRYRHGKYILGSLLSIPFLPLMYWQGNRIMRSMPMLPEASGGSGSVTNGKTSSVNLLFVGESTIAGVGVRDHQESFAGNLAREIAEHLKVNTHWKVYGKSGYTAQQVLKHILPTITETQTDLIVIGLGANDAFKLNHPVRWNRQIRSLIEQLRNKFPEAPIAFISVPPIK
ncbi:MAG: SGNH/GDSL hydrolase family protein, partial [Saprospiraceae bacterium]|nr:SGNH/GDSL hydrolase family protein [Saprospiraceae bacterium]